MPVAARPAFGGGRPGGSAWAGRVESVLEVMRGRGPVLAGWAEVLLIRRMAPLPPPRYGDCLRLARLRSGMNSARRRQAQLRPHRRGRARGLPRAGVRRLARRGRQARRRRPGHALPALPQPRRACSTRSCRAGSTGSTRPPRRRSPTRAAARPAARLVRGVRRADQPAQGRPGQDHLGDGRPRLADPHQVPGAGRRQRPGRSTGSASEGALRDGVDTIQVCRLVGGVATVADQGELDAAAVRPLLEVVADGLVR